MSEWIEWAIIAFIILGIGYVVFKGGAANPVGTGGLQRTVASIDGRLKGIEESAASKSAVERIERTLGEEKSKIDKAVGEFGALSVTLGELRNESASRNLAVEALAESLRVVATDTKQMVDRVSRVEEGLKGVERNLDRIYNVVVEKGMGR